MYVLHIIGSMDPVNGGPCQGIRNLDKGQRKMGVVREVVCIDPVDANYLGSDTFTIHALGSGWGPWRYNKNLIPWLTENIHRFDILIINGLWLYQSYGTWKAIKSIKKHSAEKATTKVFVMPHGMLDPYFQLAKKRWLKAIRNFLYWKLIESKVVNDADGLLFTSEMELLLARKTFSSYHPRREFNVSYGIAAPPAYHQNMTDAFIKICPAINGSPYLLFLSRVHEKKGVDILIKAYSTLAVKYTQIPKLVIAGPGLETAFGKKVRKLADMDVLSRENIFFTGMLTGDVKWGAYYGCEAFVLPSHQENFGIAVAEALACSKPVLISEEVNIWREIQAGGAGIINDDTLQGAIGLLEKWLSLTTEVKSEMGMAAYACYKKNFAIEYSAEIFFKAISS